MKDSLPEWVKGLLEKYRRQWRYLIVGVCTTAINYAVYFLLTHLGVFYILANILAWVIAVTFSYFANGAWVYSASSSRSWHEAGAFFLSRLFSLGLETVLLFLLVQQFGAGRNIAKIAVNVLIIVVNYLTGLLVYRKP